MSMRGKQAKILSQDNLEDLLLIAETGIAPVDVELGKEALPALSR
jgi:hypothetical protein